MVLSAIYDSNEYGVFPVTPFWRVGSLVFRAWTSYHLRADRFVSFC